MLNNAYCSDKYQYTMGKSFYDSGMKDKVAVFNLFYRKAPENNNWAVVSGTDEVIEMVEHLGNMDPAFFEKFLPGEEYAEFRGYLSSMKFTGNIYAMREGEIVFPNQPIIIVEGPLIEAQVLETPMLCIMNHQMAVATKASRVCRATDRPVSEFGSRRAHGPWAATYGAKAALIAGCQTTSNILTGAMFDYGSTGTMAHSYVTAFGSSVKGEYKAFDTYIKTHKNEGLILLIDTYDTLKCGVLNAIRAFKDNGIDDSYEAGYGVRLDSGDLAYLSAECRRILDENGLNKCKIFATNSLDEYLIRDMIFQGARVDSYGVGERLITASSEAVFGGVYKLAAVEKRNGEVIPKIKISENTAKITLPGIKIPWRLFDRESGKAIADVITLNDEKIISGEPYEIFDPIHTWKRKTVTDFIAIKLQKQIFKGGKCVYDSPAVSEIATYRAEQVDSLWDEVTRFEKPHTYYVDLSHKLWDLRNELLNKARFKGEN